jgi:serine/threonine protein kinase
MGFVYRARQRGLDRLVAVKLFPRDAYAADPSFAERFANEARILASLSHPNIVAAYEFGESDRYCHLVMELIDGQSLRQRIEQEPIAMADAIEIATQVCDALEYAHSRGVIHRDIKPENILLESSPGGGGVRVRVADFGLAKLVQRRPSDFSMTAPNRLMGTPDYMAPEQRVRPADVDARADVYALGVVLYEMLAGQLPLGRFGPPTADAGINRIVLRCLETRREDRYASVGEVRRELAAWSKRRSAYRWPWAAAAAALLLGAVGVGIYLRPTKQPVSTGFATSAPTPSPAVAASQPTPSTTTPTPTPTIPSRPLPPSFPDHGYVAVAIPVGPPWPNGARTTPPPYMGGVGAGAGIGAGGPAAFYDRMVAEHGESRVVRVFVDDLTADGRTLVVDRLRELSGASSTSSSGSARSVSVILAPVRDLEGLAKQIDFGTVVKIDPAKRIIEVICTRR